MNIVIMLGIVGGTALLKADLPPLTLQKTATPFGFAELYRGDCLTVLKRHQFNTPPAQINHRANLAALKAAGVDSLILICSTGAMKEEYRPGTFVIASDLFCPWTIPTFHEHDIFHVPPSLDETLGNGLKELVPEAKPGVYLQTNGPRFETRSEIAAFSDVADVVGMTAASEVTLANELGIPVAVFCTVANYSTGICSTERVLYEDMLHAAEQGADMMTKLISKIVDKFA